MAGIDFYIDVTGERDLVLDETGDFRFTTSIEESLSQRLYNRLSTWQGEWDFNTIYGTPYKTQIKNSGKTKDELDSLIKSIVYLEEDVTSVTVDSTKDASNRVYDIRRLNVFHNEADIEIPISSVAEKTNTYPTPFGFDDFVICSLGETTLDSINRLHKFINLDGLPEHAPHTWWQKWTGILAIEESAKKLHGFINVDGLPEHAPHTWWQVWNGYGISQDDLNLFDTTMNEDYPESN